MDRRVGGYTFLDELAPAVSLDMILFRPQVFSPRHYAKHDMYALRVLFSRNHFLNVAILAIEEKSSIRTL